MSKLKLLLCFISIQLLCFISHAAGEFGLNLGFGLPFTSQYGLNYVFSSDYSAEIRYSNFKLDVDLAKVELSKPEINFKWHPFSGSFYLGLGVGQQTLTASATDALSGLSAKATVTSTVVTSSLGWMWGMSDGGLFAGMDFGYQKPVGVGTTIETTMPVTDQAYIDTVEAGNDFGDTALPLFTIFRLGYFF